MFRVVDYHSSTESYEVPTQATTWTGLDNTMLIVIHWVGPFVQNVWNSDRKNLAFVWNWGSPGEGKEEPMRKLHRRE